MFGSCQPTHCLTHYKCFIIHWCRNKIGSNRIFKLSLSVGDNLQRRLINFHHPLIQDLETCFPKPTQSLYSLNPVTCCANGKSGSYSSSGWSLGCHLFLNFWFVSLFHDLCKATYLRLSQTSASAWASV